MLRCEVFPFKSVPRRWHGHSKCRIKMTKITVLMAIHSYAEVNVQRGIRLLAQRVAGRRAPASQPIRLSHSHTFFYYPTEQFHFLHYSWCALVHFAINIKPLHVPIMRQNHIADWGRRPTVSSQQTIYNYQLGGWHFEAPSNPQRVWCGVHVPEGQDVNDR